MHASNLGFLRGELLEPAKGKPRIMVFQPLFQQRGRDLLTFIFY